MKVKIHGDVLLLLAFYVPPPFNSTTLSIGFGFMAMHPSISVLWLGGFNVLDPSIDRLCRSTTTLPPTHPTRFARMLLDFNLVDTWRTINPTTKAYSCYSMSHIDLILISQSLQPRLTAAGFSPRSLSDHCPYWATLSLPHKKTPATWRLNPFWLTLLPQDDDIVADWEQYLAINEGTATPQSVWDAFKLHDSQHVLIRSNAPQHKLLRKRQRT